jgi:hypothetical protein
MAGFMALAQQRAGRDIGFANPPSYANVGSAAYHDVTAACGLGRGTRGLRQRC